ncbi:MAG TPA: hypothetical protein GX714_09740 [Chloroflexi bacterium]|nr:hypothetical protein [Chloroflexota bacterium]
MTEPPQTSVPPTRFVGLLVGMIRHPRATLEHIFALPRRPWRRVALVIIVAAILPVVAAYSTPPAQATAPFDGGAVAPGPGAVSAVPVGPRGVNMGVDPGRVGMEPGEMMPMPRPSPLAGLVLPALGSTAGLVVNWLLWSGVLYVIGTMVGGRNTFGHMLHMIIWTWVPYGVRGILQAGYIWITKEPIAHQGLSGLVAAETASMGVSLTPSMGTVVLQSLLGRVDIYLFWHVALVVVGLVTVAHLSQRKALTLALASWVLLTLLGLLPSVILGSFAGLRLG